MGDYTQLRLKERRQLLTFLTMGLSVQTISERLKRHRSTIYREISRNSVNGRYVAFAAHQMSHRRKRRKPRKLKVGTSCYHYVLEKLKLGWSPEQISGRMRRLSLPDTVCHETIYQYIYRHAKGDLHGYLPLQRKHRRKQKGRKPRYMLAFRSLHMRPDEVETRETLGHWEGDTIRFSGQRRQSITTLVERKSRYLVLQKNERSTSEVVMKGIQHCIRDFPKKYWQTLTFDQGSEFASFALVERYTKCKVYYANPSSPWQRGTNENTNKRLRRFLPKKANIQNVSQKELTDLADLCNKTPRKCLGFLTPKEVFFNHKKLTVALDSGV